jgi:hypothetical protein
MRINDLIVESNNLDEISLAGVGKGIAKGLGGIARGAGMVSGLGAGMKRAYSQGKATSASAVSNRQRTGTQQAPASVVAPATGPANINSILQIINKLDQPAKQQLAKELEKSIAATPNTPAAPSAATQPAPTTPTKPAPAAPAASAATQPAVKRNPNNPDDLGFGFDGNTGLPFKSQAERDAGLAKEKAAVSTAAAPASTAQSLDLNQLKQQNAAKQAAGVAGQQQAQQQMAATSQANAATAGQDAAIKAASDAAKAKPSFQQTAADKLAIKAAADKGIREAKENKVKKKVVAEFHSRFLGIEI